MKEDKARNRNDNGAEKLALLRTLALNLAKLEPSKGTMRGKRERVGLDNAYHIQPLARAGNAAELL